jgi:hypothetical protein
VVGFPDPSFEGFNEQPERVIPLPQPKPSPTPTPSPKPTCKPKECD